MKETPIDPSKIRGKFVPPPSTDITADPINSPPEKTYKKPTAKFVEHKRITKSLNVPTLLLAILFLLTAIIIPSVMPQTAVGYPLSSTLVIVCAIASLVFTMKNYRFFTKEFPAPGIKPLYLIAIANLFLIFFAIISLIGFFLLTSI